MDKGKNGQRGKDKSVKEEVLLPSISPFSRFAVSPFPLFAP
jgi:hypothetical protein